MTYFLLEPGSRDAEPRARVVIEVAAPGGGGGWIHWRHVSGPSGPVLSNGPFETEEEALADACRQIGAAQARAIERPR